MHIPLHWSNKDQLKLLCSMYCIQCFFNKTTCQKMSSTVFLHSTLKNFISLFGVSLVVIVLFLWIVDLVSESYFSFFIPSSWKYIEVIWNQVFVFGPVVVKHCYQICIWFKWSFYFVIFLKTSFSYILLV